MRLKKSHLPSLAAAIAVLVFSASAARPASAQATCAPGDPCTCSTYAYGLVDLNVNCGNGLPCDGNVPNYSGYGNAEQATSSTCFDCCGSQLPLYSLTGDICIWTSPVKQKQAVNGEPADSVMVFARDCQGNYTLVQIGGSPYAS